MAVDVDQAQSPGWWMQYLWRQLSADQRRLKLLEDYRSGRPPIVLGSESLKSAFYRFQRTSRSNFADLIVQAMVERMAVRAIRTSAGANDNGDPQAQAMFKANGLDIFQADVYQKMATMGKAFVAIGEREANDDDPNSKWPVITVEDPRQVTVAQDPLNPLKRLAAFKIYHDPMAGEDVAILWLPGEKWVATKPCKTRAHGAMPPASDPLAPPPVVLPAFSASAFTMDAAQCETYEVTEIPVVQFGNRDGVGEFERHVDLLDRINHMILQRLVIATLQAFRQRAIELDPAATGEEDDPKSLPSTDDQGNQINYDDLYAADPGALWTLPAGAKIWESGQVDLTGILSAVSDDVQHLATVTRTPFSMFIPEANQSADGANLQREGLTYKIKDRDRICGHSWSQVASIGFQFMGDTARADISQITVDWVPAESYSLQEQAQADAQATSLSVAQKLRMIWLLDPTEVAITMAQRASDALLGSLTATPPTPAPAPAPGGADDVPDAD